MGNFSVNELILSDSFLIANLRKWFSTDPSICRHIVGDIKFNVQEIRELDWIPRFNIRSEIGIHIISEHVFNVNQERWLREFSQMVINKTFKKVTLIVFSFPIIKIFNF